MSGGRYIIPKIKQNLSSQQPVITQLKDVGLKFEQKQNRPLDRSELEAKRIQWSKNRNHKALISHMIAVSKEKNRADRKRTLEYAKAKLRTDTLTPKIYNQVSLVLML